MNSSTLSLVIGVMLGITSTATYNAFQPSSVCKASDDVKEMAKNQQKTIDSLTVANQEQSKVINGLGDSLKKSSESMTTGMTALASSMQTLEKSCKK